MASELVYQPPGVYVDENAQPVPNIASIVALPPSRVAIVGPSIGYQATTDQVTLGAAAVTLTNRGVDTSTIVVKSLEGVTYAVTSDYTVTETGAVPEEAVTTITRVGGGSIPLNSIVYVSYRYTDSAFYDPFFTTDWDEIQSRFGSAIDTSTGVITSPLALAAKIVMEQGARELILVPTNSTSNAVSAAQLKSGLDRLLAREDVGIVVSMPVGVVGTDGSPGETSTVVTDLRNHVQSAAADGLFRIGIIGLDSGATRSHDILAASVDSQRVVLAYPNVLNWYNGATNQVIELSGYYLAAAYAGILASRPAQTPLTRKNVASFSNIPSRIFSTMTKAFKNNLSSTGVAVTEKVADGRLVVRHGVTTDMSTVLTREISIIRAKDTLLRLVDQALERSGLVGDAITRDTPVTIRSIVEGALEQAMAGGAILGYSNLAVRQSVADPTTFEVKFAYDPSYPLNKITVSFSINTITGAIAEA